MFPSRSLPLGLLAAALLCAPRIAEAQAGVPLADRQSSGVQVRVAVTDRTTLVPLSTVQVVLRLSTGDSELVWEGTTADNGVLVTPRLLLGEYTLELASLGFADFSQPLVLDEVGNVDVSVAMVPEALALEPLIVTVRRDSQLERQGFYERQERGAGYFLTRADIDLRNPSRTSDLMMGIPGARVSSARLGQPGGAVTLRGGCVPTVVLNGGPITIPISLDELVNVHDIEAMEIYHGATGPVQFAQFTTCGTIVVWLRERSAVQHPGASGWRRLIGLGAVLGFFVFAMR